VTALKQNAVSRLVAACSQLVAIQATLSRLNVDFNGAVGLNPGTANTGITQADLDAVASFSGLTTQQLQDAVYAATATVLTAVNAAFVSLEQLAARG